MIVQYQGKIFYNPFHITDAATHADMLTGPGVLGHVNVNNAGGGSTLTIYNNTAASGAVVAVIDTTVTGHHVFEVSMATGLTCVTADNGTHADITISAG